MAHTLINYHFKKKKSFQVSPFHTPHIVSVTTDLFRVEKEREIQKGEKTGVLRGKVHVCHSSYVQVNRKMLQLVQHTCQKDRFRAGLVPL